MIKCEQLKSKFGTYELNNVLYLDCTVKSGDKVFAPSWDLVMGYKRGIINKKRYTEKYIKLMRISYRKNRKRWEEVCSYKNIVLRCYCKDGAFCHRHILKDLLEKCRVG